MVVRKIGNRYGDEVQEEYMDDETTVGHDYDEDEKQASDEQE